MNNNEKIEKILSKISFHELSREEQDFVWQNIEKKKTPSFSLLTLTLNKNMITSLIVALALTLGVGGTVVTADNARPGDTLFGIDQAVENLRLRLSSEEKKNELRIKFAEERVKEIEELTKENSSMSRPAKEDIKESSVSKIEADVFRNETVIKIEYNDNKKFVFTSEAKTKTEIVEEITKAFSALSKTFVESKLNLETEDRESKEQDRNLSANMHVFEERERNRISLGLEAALTLLNGVSASLDKEEAGELKLITDELNNYMENLPSDIKIESRIKGGEDHSRVELESEEGRIRVEIKDGEIKVKNQERNKGEEANIENKLQIKTNLEIEADIFENETVIKIELNDQKISFTTSATTKENIVNAVKEKLPTLTTTQIESVLKIEIENRDSLIEDLLDGKDNTDDGDDIEIKDDGGENEDSDDNKEDNNSGHGKNNNREDEDDN
jgi:hypothetical protein